MRQWRLPSLRRRVLVGLLLSVFLLWPILILVGYLEIQNEAPPLKQVSMAMQSVVAQIDDKAPIEVICSRILAQQKLLEALTPNTADDAVLLWQVKHETAGMLLNLGRSYRLPDTDLIDGNHRLQIGDASFDVLQVTKGPWRIRLGLTSVTDLRLLWMLGKDIWIYLMVAFLVQLIPMFIAVSGGIRPLRQWSQRIAERKPDDLRPLEEAARYSELEPMSNALNTLLCQLRGKMDQERAFVQNAAHELRTPMAVISTQAHVLASATDDDTRQQAKLHLEHAAHRASHLIGQLLQLAQLETEHAPRPAQQLDVAQLLRLSLAQLFPLAERKAQELSLQAPDQLWVTVDRDALQSIIDNLIGNAIRYVQEGGSIAVSLNLEGAYWQLQVSDNGPGIPLADRIRIFERFYRVADNTQPGTGLGLAIVKAACQRLGGSIQLGDGPEGRGTCFTVQIPMHALTH